MEILQMKLTTTTSKSFSITEVENLDRINVFVTMDGEGSGRIVIHCWDQCWTGYWGAMGGSMSDFWLRVSAGYLVNAIQSKIITSQSVKKREDAYLRRVIEAVQEAFKLHKECNGDI
jgi:hypothetical protein